MESKSSVPGQISDSESESCLSQMVDQPQVVSNRIPDVKFVLVVLSARGMVFDLSALRQKIIHSYPEVAVFFRNTDGTAIGPAAPEKVDLVIDFIGPGQRQKWRMANQLRKIARVAIGRNVGSFRKAHYDRVFDETHDAALPTESLQIERYVQRKLLNLAGVMWVQAGDTPPDRSKSIALELPGIRRL